MFKIINPIEYPDWDELLLAHEDHSFFHTSAWVKVIFESYNYKPLFFTEINNNQLTALIPVMAIKSCLTGKRGVVLPFADQCPVIASDESHFQKLLEKVIDYGRKAGWKTIEIRGGKRYLKNKMPSKAFLTHSLDLTNREQELFTKFKSTTKRNIKKAIKENVHIEILGSLKSVKEFYRLNCLTRQNHGLPPQPFYFFKKQFEHIISTGKGFVILASYRNKVIAGGVYFHFNNKALFKYGASDKKYHRLRPNNLCMYEAVKWYKQNGYKHFSFGRTEVEHKGLLQFKRGWGTQEEPLYYYKYDLKKKEFVKDASRLKFLYPIFQKLPLPLLKTSGLLLYRHIG